MSPTHNSVMEKDNLSDIEDLKLIGVKVKHTDAKKIFDANSYI
jgi:hypothetical protein